MDDAAHAVVKRSLTDIEGAFDVGIDVAVRRNVGIGNCDQCSEVEDDIHIFGDVLAVMRVTNVAVQNFDFFATLHILKPAPIVEGVVLRKGFNLVTFAHEEFGEMRADKTVGAGNENIHLS